jgi:hypothetical protein
LETLLFLIIAGIFSMLLSKGKGKNNKPFQTGKPFRANTFDDIKKLFQDEIKKEMGTDLKDVVNKDNIPKKVQEVKQEFTDSQSKWGSPQQPAVQHSRIGNLAPEKVEEEESIISEVPDGDTLINGIIWTEILGEPRSRKSFFANKR